MTDSRLPETAAIEAQIAARVYTILAQAGYQWKSQGTIAGEEIMLAERRTPSTRQLIEVRFRVNCHPEAAYPPKDHAPAEQADAVQLESPEIDELGAARLFRQAAAVMRRFCDIHHQGGWSCEGCDEPCATRQLDERAKDLADSEQVPSLPPAVPDTRLPTPEPRP